MNEVRFEPVTSPLGPPARLGDDLRLRARGSDDATADSHGAPYR